MKKLKPLFILLFLLIVGFGLSKYLQLNSVKTTAKVTANTDIEKPHIKKKLQTTDAIPEGVLNSNAETYDSQNTDLRKFPYPYSAMLAICSDIDDTTLEEFRNYHRFLNTKEKTDAGEGIGLDVGDSMWMYMADNVKYKVDKYGNGVDSIMTYFKGISKSEKHNSNEIVHFYKSGWIDCLHSFGDFSTKNEKGTSFKRDLASNAWQTLKSDNIKPVVWINHGNKSNRQNFGAYSTSSFMNYQQGDNPKSYYYHTDLTIPNGIKYVWNSLNDNNFGHDYPLYEISLRDGAKVWGFYRYTNDLVNGKIDWTWVPKYLHKQLSQSNLDSIVTNKQYSIVGQHLGVDAEDLYSDDNIKSLRLLKQYENDGKIVVTKTSRLLNYANAHKYLMYNKVTNDDLTYINITSINDPIFGKYVPNIDNVRGITFYCDDPKNTILLLNKTKIDNNELQINSKDETGKSSISIKWFKQDYTDYTKQT
ncbi:hypothetical protein [Clostridium thailandense]|uniref:hypothetical protein n=1 Tax=Clostridium thailandense TaxID=2794346 RepID=UPI00398A174F